MVFGGMVHGDFVARGVRALGITQARWIHDYFRIKPRLKDADLDALVAQGRLTRVRTAGHIRSMCRWQPMLAGPT